MKNLKTALWLTGRITAWNISKWGVQGVPG